MSVVAACYREAMQTPFRLLRNPEVGGQVARPIGHLQHFDAVVEGNVEDNVSPHWKTPHPVGEIRPQLAKLWLRSIRLAGFVNRPDQTICELAIMALADNVAPDVEQIIPSRLEIQDSRHRVSLALVLEALSCLGQECVDVKRFRLASPRVLEALANLIS